MANSWRTKQYPRLGKPWTGFEMRTLKRLFDAGVHLNQISHKLQRTPESCDDIYRDIRRTELMNTGGENDTLITMKKKKVKS